MRGVSCRKRWENGRAMGSTPNGWVHSNCLPLDTIRDELEELANCIRAGESPETGGQEALEVVEVFEAVLESVRNERVVDLNEIRAR
jgi:predicted dehydrogenase